MDKQQASPVHTAERVLRGLEWRVLRRLDGLLHGDYRGLVRGIGDDLADLREYQMHDDVRHIDWNVTARLTVPQVRQFHEDRDLTAWFLVDLSASADTGLRSSRAAVALDFVGTMALLLARRGNRIGALRYRDGVDLQVPAGTARLHVLRLVHSLLQPTAAAPADQTSEPGSATRLHHLLDAARSTLKRRSQVFVLSDFYAEPGWGPALAQLALRHDVVAVRLTDPLDGALPDLGLLLLGDAETGEQILIDTRDRGLRRRHARLVAEREQQIRSALMDAGVDTLELSTADDLVDALVRFVRLRRRVALQRGATAPAARAIS